MGSKWHYDNPFDLSDFIARDIANDLRDIIHSATQDGRLDNSEVSEIANGYRELQIAITIANDDSSLPAETSPYFSTDRSRQQPLAVDKNLHSSRPPGFPKRVRPGFELNALDAISETSSDPAVNIDNFWKGLEPLDPIPASLDELLDYIRNELSDYPNQNNGPSVGTPGRPGHLDPSHDPLDLGSQPHSAPKPGFNVTSPTGYSSRGLTAPEGPEAFGGGNDHDPGDNRSNGPSGGHVQGNQHPGNTNGTGHSGSHGGRGGFTPSAGGGHGDTSSLKGNSGRDNPPGDVSTHDPYHNGTGARPVVFDLSGNGIGKSTIFIGAGDDRLLQRAQQGSGDVI